MERPGIDARSLVDRLWRAAAAEEAVEREGELPRLPASDHVQHRDDLAELNRRYLVPGPVDPELPEADGPWGRVKRHIVRLAAEVVHTMLDRYFAAEREFVAHLVRFQNELAKKADRHEDEIRVLSEAAQREIHALWTENRRLAERIEVLHALVEARVERLEAGAKG